MRVIAEIPHLQFKATIYSWNGKYLVKIEKGMYEQTYKVSEMDVVNDEEVKKLVADEVFVKGVLERFKNMNKDLNEALNRL